MLSDMLIDVDDEREEARPKRPYSRPDLPDSFSLVSMTPVERARWLQGKVEDLEAQIADLKTNLTRAIQTADTERRRADCFERAAQAVHRAAFRVTRS